MHEPSNLLASTTTLVAAAIAAGTLRDAAAVPALIAETYRALEATTGPAPSAERPIEDMAPPAAVSVRKSLASPDHILSMIDGKPYKTLRRHLATHGLTPEQYRERYSLPATYPMVAPTYSESRRDMAKKIGLGRKPGSLPAAAQ